MPPLTAAFTHVYIAAIKLALELDELTHKIEQGPTHGR